jgi:hypothetical protein
LESAERERSGAVTQFDDVNDLVSGEESTDPNVGKYFKVEVPNYANATGTDGKVSYLRVGAARTDWQNEPGADLVGLAYLVGTAGNEYGTDLAEKENVVTSAAGVWCSPPWRSPCRTSRPRATCSS